MLNRLKFFFYVLLTSVLLSACAGEDGDPGPQGEPGVDGIDGVQKMGFFEGTVSGKRKDGTAFSETFKYEYTSDSIQAFNEGEDSKRITLSRYFNSTSDAGLTLYLAQSEGVFAPQSSSYSVYFSFFKELNADNLFRIDARAYFEPTEAFVRELSAAENEIYQFSTTGQNSQIYYSYSYYSPTGEDAYRFNHYESNVSYNVFYSETGELLSVYNQNEGEHLLSGELFDRYNKLKFKYNATLDMMVFYNAATDAGLYEEFADIPADQLNITNYARNSTTGVVTFDYELKISGSVSNSARVNSTRNDLTIKGKFNSGGKVFTNTTGRVKS